jgi:hypothetical protein
MMQQQPFALGPQHEEADANPVGKHLARVLGRERVEEAPTCSICIEAADALQARAHCLDAQARKRLALAPIDSPESESGARHAI